MNMYSMASSAAFTYLALVEAANLLELTMIYPPSSPTDCKALHIALGVSFSSFDSSEEELSAESFSES
ncbi:hypothetical protein E2C01_044933 [Portunus trituberculatus]|uniref:Secreted protein n=1 Tax=Portunus trituberculatus TaxID=210409 RepID=A0A5B7G0P0_PORTR|nr:hypothetical protein [Portunus trituberculatus]